MALTLKIEDIEAIDQRVAAILARTDASRTIEPGALYTVEEAARLTSRGAHIAVLEVISDQHDAFLSGGLAETVTFLDRLIEDPALPRKILGRTLSGYTAGDLQVLKQVRVQGMSLRPELMRAALNDREDRWIPKIREIMKTGIPTLIAAGAMHFVGPEGLMARLSAEYGIDLFRP